MRALSIGLIAAASCLVTGAAAPAAAPSYLLVHTVAYGGVTQSQTVFRYGSTIECASALQKMQLNFTATSSARLARPMICLPRRPDWWIQDEAI